MCDNESREPIANATQIAETLRILKNEWPKEKKKRIDAEKLKIETERNRSHERFMGMVNETLKNEQTKNNMNDLLFVVCMTTYPYADGDTLANILKQTGLEVLKDSSSPNIYGKCKCGPGINCTRDFRSRICVRNTWAVPVE